MEYIEPNSERWLCLDNLPNERWKDIESYEGLYQISDYGRVKSYYTNKILKCGIDKRGYTRVSLCKNKKIGYYRINRLVACAFIPNDSCKPLVLHIKPVDKDYCNNNVDNLYWGTSTENNQTTVVQRRGNGYVVLQYDIDNNIINSYDSCREAGRLLGLVPEYIASCCRGNMKQYANYVWRYEKDVKNELEI